MNGRTARLGFFGWDYMSRGNRIEALLETVLKISERFDELELRHGRLLQRLGLREAQGGELLPEVPTDG